MKNSIYFKLLKSSLEGKKYFLIIFIATIFASLFRLGLSLVTQYAIDIAIKGESIRLFWILACGGIFIGLCNISQYLRGIYSTYSLELISKNLRCKYYEFIEKMYLRNSEKYSHGELMTLLTDDINCVAGFIPQVVREFTFGIVQTVSSFIYCFAVSWKLSIVALLTIFLSIWLSKLFSALIENTFKEKQKEEEKLRTFLQDRLRNKAVTKSFFLESIHKNDFCVLYKQRTRRVMKLTKLESLYTSLGEFSGTISIIITVIIGIIFIQYNEITYGEFLGFITIMSVLFWPFLMMPDLISTLIREKASMERLLQLEEEQEELSNFEHEKFIDYLPSHIAAKDLSFSYEPDSTILDKFSLEANRGEIIGIIGPSGVGKSTALKLLLSLYKPDKGDIYLENEKGKRLSGVDMRYYISYVPQGNIISSISILDNILVGNSNKDISDVIEAAKKAHAHDFIIDTPNQYNTILSENGMSLSEGQRQRISMGRAIIKNAPILVLDEVSSALDEQSENAIISTIKTMSKEKIIIMVAHTEKMINLCTKIYTLDKII